MNEYKITYTGESEGYQLVIERTEAAAKKFFLSMNKGIKLDITSIELYRENAIATKQQERDTLAAIRKMVEELGPQSYLATAFDGCFEDAESNIENDFADSMKARWLHADAQLNAAKGTIEELKDQLEESKKDWEAAHAAAHAIAEQKDAEIAALRERAISPDDLTDAIQLVAEKQFTLNAEVKEVAEQIVETATEPGSASFQNAVKQHRAAKSQLDYYTALLERLIKAKGE
jgi:hypothetical protein